VKQIICDGCKVAEEFENKGPNASGKTIKRVELEVWEDERDSVPRVPILADLCENCRVEMLAKYFRQTVDNTEAIMPESLRAVRDE
jgi:hypothetical protein